MFIQFLFANTGIFKVTIIIEDLWIYHNCHYWLILNGNDNDKDKEDNDTKQCNKNNSITFVIETCYDWDTNKNSLRLYQF